MSSIPNEYEQYMTKRNTDFIETFSNLVSESPFMGVLFVVGTVILLFAGLNEINFRMKYALPPKYTSTYQQIDPQQEPIQIEPSSAKPFMLTASNGDKYNILPAADYSISAMVVAKNTNVWLRGVMNSSFDNIALIDFGFLCGKVANDETLKYVRFQSKKILSSARELRPMPNYWKSQQNAEDYFVSQNLSMDYFFSHMSHVHVIPADNNIMATLMRLHKKDIVKLNGYLVDINYKDGRTSRTSLSRSDTNETSRGNGACEIMYVTNVQVGNKIYQ